MKHPYYYYQNQLDLVESIEQLASNVEIEDGKTGENDSNNNDGLNTSVRNCKVKWLHDNSLRTEIMNLFMQANAISFGFNIEHIKDLQYTIYDGNQSEVGNYYKWHADNNYMNDKFVDRKLSLVIMLSDPHEYEGGRFDLTDNKISPEGELEFFQPPEFKKKGDIIVFPSFMHHRVNPVTAGLRKTFVAWAEGPKFR